MVGPAKTFEWAVLFFFQVYSIRSCRQGVWMFLASFPLPVIISLNFIVRGRLAYKHLLRELELCHVKRSLAFWRILKTTLEIIFSSAPNDNTDITKLAARCSSLAGLSARPWFLVEICSRQEIINIYNHRFIYRDDKIGMEARYNCCEKASLLYIASTQAYTRSFIALRIYVRRMCQF
ncbi:hypothetical protein QVD17_02099 [Tagetes erecta]|uniref:Uncharacterized protein n=1 Tax=Tagetes erecta TaxID=13708 RepID=A0AAD8P231_TARER|nr:hypothetical protein QVD17_02099 [Tagetes erecta]